MNQGNKDIPKQVFFVFMVVMGPKNQQTTICNFELLRKFCCISTYII